MRDFWHWAANILPTDRQTFDLDHYLRQSPRAEDYDLRAKLEQWLDEGIVTFEDCVAEADTAALLEDIAYLSEHREEFELEVEYRGARYSLKTLPGSPLADTGVKFNCLENISHAARRLSLNAIICSFLRHVFQSTPVVIQSLTFWRGSEQPVHRDYPWVTVQTRLPHLAASWIALEDVAEDSGPLAYYPGSHRHGLIPPFDWGGGSIEQTPESVKTAEDFVRYLGAQAAMHRLKKKLFLPKRGSALIWHGNLVHEGTQVAKPDRTRKSYVTHYTSAPSYPESCRYADAMEAGRYTALNGGYVFDHPWVNDSRALPSWRRSTSTPD